MSSLNTVILAAIGYALFLFLIAFLSDRRDRPRWLNSPRGLHLVDLGLLHVLDVLSARSGSAARNGLEFVTIYLGPTLVFIGWWFCPAQTGAHPAGASHHLHRRPDLLALRQEHQSGHAGDDHRGGRHDPLHRLAATGGQHVFHRGQQSRGHRPDRGIQRCPLSHRLLGGRGDGGLHDLFGTRKVGPTNATMVSSPPLPSRRW